ncbi:hypothetical protein PG995_005919 [Apiospora arundinis]
MTRHRNEQSSRLYKIPNEITLEICKYLEGSDVYIARQTCALFRQFLSTPRFVQETNWTDAGGRPLRPNRSSELPRLRTDWGDIIARLRRRRCCSACINARVPVCGEGFCSLYEKVMSRMLNNVKWCEGCKTTHPLLMFSHSQRGMNPGAKCILRTGGVTVCPHYTLSISNIYERPDLALWSYKHGEVVFKCDKCFDGISGYIKPTVSLDKPEILTRRRIGDGQYKYVKHQVKIKWRISLSSDTKGFNHIRNAMVLGMKKNKAAEVVRKALAKAAEDYNHLLCGHRRFDDGSLLTQWASLLPHTTQATGLGQKSKLEPHEVPLLHEDDDLVPRNVIATTINHELCGNAHGGPDGFRHRVKWSWSYWRKPNEPGLSLEREIILKVPDFGASFDSTHLDWIQMMSPASYGIQEDMELRHITWCPDETCANARGWATHIRILCNLMQHLCGWGDMERLGPVTGTIGVSRRVEDQCRYIQP